MKKIAFAAILGLAIVASPSFVQAAPPNNNNRPRVNSMPSVQGVNSYYNLQGYYFPQNYGYGYGYNNVFRYNNYGVVATPWGYSGYNYGGTVRPYGYGYNAVAPAFWGAAYGYPFGTGWGW